VRSRGISSGAISSAPGREQLTNNQTAATVNVAHIVYFSQLSVQTPRPAQLRYLLCGKGQELFLAHLITSPRDSAERLLNGERVRVLVGEFDQFLSVRIDAHGLTDDQLRQARHVVIPERANSIRERIREGQTISGELRLSQEPGSEVHRLQIRAERELYFEEGELMVPSDFGPTEEEQAAGMP